MASWAAAASEKHRGQGLHVELPFGFVSAVAFHAVGDEQRPDLLLEELEVLGRGSRGLGRAAQCDGGQHQQWGGRPRDEWGHGHRGIL